MNIHTYRQIDRFNQTDNMFKYFIYFCVISLAVSLHTDDDGLFEDNHSLTESDVGLFQDYQALYNRSLSLYVDCVGNVDYYSELYEQEQEVSDMFMTKLEECETVSRNLTNSINYTRLSMAKRQNIELESDLLNTRKHLDACNENRNLDLSIISDLKDEIARLMRNLTAQNRMIYDIDAEINQCRDDLKEQEGKKISNFNLLESCLQREEVLRDQKNRYVIRLTTCRKNREKVLRGPKTQL